MAIAFGADLTDLDGSGWTWTDVTDDVIIGGKAGEGSGGEGDGDAVTITIGRADESTVTQTSVMKCTLDNRSGKYINTGTSTYWPYVRRGTPVRVRVTTNGGSSWSVRFQGQAVGFTPSWDKPGRWATVELEASGPLRVLDQGTLPLKSSMVIGTPTDSTVIAYWPCEDALGSASALPLIGTSPGSFLNRLNGTGATVPGTPGQFQSFTDFPASAPALGVRVNGAMSCPVGSGAFAASTSQAVFGNLSSTNGCILMISTPNGSPIKVWELWSNGDSALKIRGAIAGTTSSGDTVFETSIAFNLKANTVYKMGLKLSQSGGTTSYDFFVQEFGQTTIIHFTGTRSNSGTNACGVDRVIVNPYYSVSIPVGHVTVRNVAMSDVTADSDWFNAHQGEAVTARLPRVANQSDINVDILAPGVGIYPAYTETDTSITLDCGPQYWDTLSTTLREAEVTGQGLLYDGLGTGLTYVSRRFRQQRAAAATLTLNASSGHLMEPFDPADDDQILFNHYTVSGHGGNQGLDYLDRTGLEGVDIVGDHATSLTVNPYTQDNLIGYAEWGVNLGTVTGFRFPTCRSRCTPTPA